MENLPSDSRIVRFPCPRHNEFAARAGSGTVAPGKLDRRKIIEKGSTSQRPLKLATRGGLRSLSRCAFAYNLLAKSSASQTRKAVPAAFHRGAQPGVAVPPKRTKELAMVRYLPCTFCVVFVLAICFATGANANDAAAQTHVAAAQAAVAPAAGSPDQPLQVFQPFFKQWCAPPKQLPDVVRQEVRRVPTTREEWYQPPVRIFDQLYFIGTKGTGVYAINSPDGIAMIDTNFDWDAKDLVLELKDFGLDPQKLKYIIVTHGHDDRYWGAKSLQEAYPQAHVFMSAADWDVVAKDNSPENVKPRRDMVVNDGDQLKMGDATITMYITPGHTPGTISLIITGLMNQKSAHPDNVRHAASIWGGVDINLGRAGVQYYPDGQTMMKTYIASAKRFKELNEKAGVDTILSTTLGHANMVEKMHTWQMMNGAPGVTPEMAAKLANEPNPFVSKDAAGRFYTILEECYEAQLAWRMDP
jgi:metallo-beta-lactamase class B